jgi:hypothetical protein
MISNRTLSPQVHHEKEHHHKVGALVSEVETHDDRNIESTMYYLENMPIYLTEKPYTMRYQPEEDIPQSNFHKCEKPMTAISMRRPDVGPFNFEECGFELIEMRSEMSYEDFSDNEKIQSVYIQEVREAIKHAIGAKFVWVLDYAVCVPQFEDQGPNLIEN